MKHIPIVSVVCLLAAACSANPYKISPTFVSEVGYSQYGCSQLINEQGRVDNQLSMAVAAQTQARTTDTWGMLFVGLPIANLTGSNVAYQVANLKGQQIAIHKALNMKNCSFELSPAWRQTR